MTQSVKSSGIAAESQIQPKQPSHWICVALKLDKFSELCIAKPLSYRLRGAKTFGVPRYVHTNSTERLLIVMVANPTEGYGIFIENMLAAAQQGVQPKAA